MKLSGAFMPCCEGFEQDIGENSPEPMPTNIRRAVEECTANGKPNFLRIINADLRPVIQNAQMSSSNAAASSVLLTVIPCALDSFRQLLRPAYAIFNKLDRESMGSEEMNIRLARAILEHNKVLRGHVRRRTSTALAKMQIRLIGFADTATNLAVMNADEIFS
jgi:hypothetical protein